MEQDKGSLGEAISMAQVFRLERNRWPFHAAELLAFSRAWGKGLDYSGLHMLVLREVDDWALSMEYALLREGEGLASCGRLELRRVALTDTETTFQWTTRHLPLPPKKVKATAYCFIG